MRYSVRHIAPLSALLYGLLLGAVAWLLPGLALGWLTREAVVRLQGWLSGLRFVLPIPLTEGIPIDLAALLQLSDAQAQLTSLAARGGALVLAVMLATVAAGMLLTGLSAMVGALLYNLLAGLFGGVEVRLDALDAPAAPPVAPRRRSAPAQAQPNVANQPTVYPAVAPPVARPANANRPLPPAWLVPVAGVGGAGERLPLRDDVTRIGSAPDNDIVLSGLSPEHAEIRREGGRYLIYDLGSRRTWVNDAQVAAVHMLKDGFRLQLGQAEFLVQITAN